MSKLSFWRTICFVCVFCVATSIASAVATFRTLVSFDGPDGAEPSGPLVQGLDGNFYGTTAGGGGTNGYGTFFKVTPGGKLTTLHIFDFAEGEPYAGLVQAADGNFYGTTYGGGVNHIGSVFKVTAGGKLTALHSFDGTDGGNPNAALVQASDGNLYGTTSDGGLGGYGTVFKITPTGKLTTLHNFDLTDGAYPSAGLVQGTNGNFYGTTSCGGTGSACIMGTSSGTVFEITAGGKLTTLHNFNGTDGGNPSGLVQAANGNLYGTTLSGGTSDACYDSCGTVFEITAGGKLTTLHSFDGSDGSDPGSGLAQATDGSFYGTTNQGGASANCSGGCGTIFEITPAGKLTTLHSFDSTDGAVPNGLVQATNGNFYGTAGGGASSACGAFGCGTVFSLALLRQGGSDRFYPRNESGGLDKRHVQRQGGGVQGGFEHRNQDHRTERRDHRQGQCENAPWHVDQQRELPGDAVDFEVLAYERPCGHQSGDHRRELTGATSVTFAGVKATFTVDSYTQITATVTSGAKMGKIGVTTRGGTATSTATFTVN